jgi:hypothetical protein
MLTSSNWEIHLKVNIGSTEWKGAEGIVFWITKEKPIDGILLNLIFNNFFKI